MTQEPTIHKVIELWLCQNKQFRLIEDPEVFIEAYERRVRQEEASFSLPLTIGFGIFEVREISHPRIDNEETTLVFYVEIRGVPRKVTCSYPLDPVDPHANCQLLAYRKKIGAPSPS